MVRLSGALIALGLLLGSVTAGRVWVRFTLTDPVLGPQALTATGYEASPALSAVSILALAAGLVVLLTRHTPRMVALLVLVADSTWAAWLAVAVLIDPADAVRQQDIAQVGTLTAEGLPVSADSSTLWVAVFLGAAAAVLAGCVILFIDVMRGRALVRTARSTAPRATPPASTESRPDASSPAEVERRANAAAWNELSEGKDPTIEP